MREPVRVGCDQKAGCPIDADEPILLELKPVADPQARRGLPARDPMYRLRLRLLLKRAARDYGFSARWGRLDDLPALNRALAERVAAQSEILSRRAYTPVPHPCG